MYKTLQKLLDKHETNASQVAKATGISKASFTGWKQGITKPSVKHILVLSEYFGVSPSVFLNEYKENEKKVEEP